MLAQPENLPRSAQASLAAMCVSSRELQFAIIYSQHSGREPPPLVHSWIFILSSRNSWYSGDAEV